MMVTEVTIEENSTFLSEISIMMTSAKSNDNDLNFQETEIGDSDEEFLIWAIIDGLLLIAILCGNVMTILAVRYSRRLRSVISNLFVLSLAISDILVGLTLPYHLAFYLGTNLGSNKYLCLLRFFFVIMACCVSIWNLISIALDRYLAICYPLHYSRYMTRRLALNLIALGWLVGLTIAAIPLIWNKWEYAQECEFDEIFYPWYMVGMITPIFSLVWLVMLFVYCRIWREASKQVKQLRTQGQQDGTSDWKSVQMVLLILGCFTVCWLPYFIVACSQIYRIIERSSAVAYMAAFTLAMSNSAMNPVIYAWKNSNFRQAFTNLLKCKSPDTLEPSQSMRSNLHRKSSSAQHQDGISGAFANYSTPPLHLQRKIEPNINAMGITFEEDEDKMSNSGDFTARTNVNISPNIITSNAICHPPVTIRIESDIQNNSIVISTTTLPDFHHDSCSVRESNGGVGDDESLDRIKRHRTGNLIVNKLMENYGITEPVGDHFYHRRSSGRDFLEVDANKSYNNNSTGGNLRIKSKSTNSIAIVRSPNKSSSNSSIFDYTNSKYRINDCNIDGKSLDSRNHFPPFNFGRKFISRSFNSSSTGTTAVPSICKFNSSSTSASHNNTCNNTTSIYRKSAELNFQS